MAKENIQEKLKNCALVTAVVGNGLKNNKEKNDIIDTTVGAVDKSRGARRKKCTNCTSGKCWMKNSKASDDKNVISDFVENQF